MLNSTFVLRFLGSVAGLMVAAAASGQVSQAPAAPLDRVQLEKRLESVRTLLERSSAAKQIDASGDQHARDERARAFGLLEQARKALNDNDLPSAQKLLLEAPKVMTAAARLAAPEQILKEKVKADYDSRRDSVKALLAAQKRIRDEKGDSSGARDAATEIEKMLGEADQLAAAGKFEQGRAVVDKAYLVAKASVGSMRSGDTLVRSLNFASVEDEYKYELDRNDTHAMLIKVLVDQKGSGNPMIDGLVKKAREIRDGAESAAGKGDFKEGIRLLENSTKELVKAIRSAGIYIPG